MATTNRLIIFNKSILVTRAVQGASIALILIVLFLIPVGEGKTEWGKFWILRPLIIVPIAGAFGAVWYYLISNLQLQNPWLKSLARIAGVIAFVISIWLGTILGLDGTLWN